MGDKSKARKKGSIGEDVAAALLRRLYSANTVLALLREISEVAAEKIDWHELVKNTATGITSARECQILWRYMAYGETLIEPPGDDSRLADDDSDTEFEMEASPTPGREASFEASAYVKVLMTSGHSNDAEVPNNSTIEAPLFINTPNSHGASFIIPVTLQKQSVPSGTQGGKRPSNGVPEGDLHLRRKRRNWSTEEDAKLTAAVQAHGERNWSHIVKEEFINDRSPSELSHRWASLKRKQGDSKAGNSSQTPEMQLAATNRAMSLALNMPMGEILKVAGQTNTGNNLSALFIYSACSWLVSAPQANQQLGKPAAPPKPQPSNAKLPVNNPAATPDSMVKAAAVAAGARIATLSDASSFMEATRSQNVVHISSSATGAEGSATVKKPSGASIAAGQLPSNVHFIRNGLAKAPIASYSSPASKPSSTSNPSDAHLPRARS
ncbi:hypothetical protein M569_11916, partial [Genlisea aurea]